MKAQSRVVAAPREGWEYLADRARMRQLESSSGAMKTYLRALGFFAVVYAVGAAARMLLAPGVVAIADSEHADPRLLVAFLLKSIENVGLYGAMLVLVYGALWLLTSLVRGTIKR